MNFHSDVVDRLFASGLLFLQLLPQLVQLVVITLPEIKKIIRMLESLAWLATTVARTLRVLYSCRISLRVSSFMWFSTSSMAGPVVLHTGVPQLARAAASATFPAAYVTCP